MQIAFTNGLEIGNWTNLTLHNKAVIQWNTPDRGGTFGFTLYDAKNQVIYNRVRDWAPPNNQKIITLPTRVERVVFNTTKWGINLTLSFKIINGGVESLFNCINCGSRTTRLPIINLSVFKSKRNCDFRRGS